METRTYTTYAEAVEREIVETINAGDANADNYNIDAIADAVLGGHEDGYALKVDTDEFWETVEANEL